MRILHFSDPHLGTSLHRAELTGWLGKRAIGGANLLLRRRRLFADAAEKLAALARFKNEQGVDLVICTGDYTALGLTSEYAASRRAVAPLMDAPLGYVTVPGNHDLYLMDVVREGRFGTYFGDTLTSDLPELQVDGVWPLVRLIGDSLAVVALNSSRPNPLPWRSSGEIPEKQLAVLAALPMDVRIANRFVLIVTHYAPLLADGALDRRLHGLRNGPEFLAACAGFRRAAVLCGHVHHRYRVRIPQTETSIFCAGSATMRNREGFWLFELGDDGLTAKPGRWNGTAYRVASG